jgi:F-type H+-transporting ATPase subunit O
MLIFQPPIHVFGVEGRYAHALYSAAVKEKKLDAIEKEIKAVQVLLLL